MTLLSPGKYTDADGEPWHVFDDGSMVYDDNDPDNSVYPALFTDTEVPEAYKIVRDYGPFTRVTGRKYVVQISAASGLLPDILTREEAAQALSEYPDVDVYELTEVKL